MLSQIEAGSLSRLVRWAGICGFAAVVLELVGVAFWYIGGGVAPSPNTAENVARYLGAKPSMFVSYTFFNSLAVGLLYPFFVGLGALFARAGALWQAVLVVTSGLSAAVLVLLAGAMIGAAALQTLGQSEPVAARTLFQSEGVVFAVAQVPAALAAGATAWVATRRHLLSSASRWLGWAAAVINLVTLPAIYGGSDPHHFWSATGGAQLVAQGVLLLWILTTGAAMARARALF